MTEIRTTGIEGRSSATIKLAEKERQRLAISEQTQQFLDAGGRITVITDHVSAGLVAEYGPIESVDSLSYSNTDASPHA
ncbi:MAG: hypothetical protein AAGC91_04255 [Pseudomonadota bacterium]